MGSEKGWGGGGEMGEERRGVVGEEVCLRGNRHVILRK